LNAPTEKSASAPQISIPAEAKKIQSKVPVTRDGKILGEYSILQLPTLLDTGHLLPEDHCLDPETNESVHLADMITRIPTYTKRTRRAAEPEMVKAAGQRRSKFRKRALLFISVSLVVAFLLGLIAWKSQQETRALTGRLARAESECAAWKEKFHKVLFAAREVADGGFVRGRIILRDATGRRTALPGVKLRIYPRAQIESHLNARHESESQAGGTDPTRLAAHYLKGLPDALDSTSSNSDGRFELKVPEPGEYVVQTAIRSEKTGQLRLWFVRFDSTDPLNTPVDITESNSIQQFNPLLMVVDGR